MNTPSLVCFLPHLQEQFLTTSKSEWHLETLERLIIQIYWTSRRRYLIAVYSLRLPLSWSMICPIFRTTGESSKSARKIWLFHRLSMFTCLFPLRYDFEILATASPSYSTWKYSKHNLHCSVNPNSPDHQFPEDGVGPNQVYTKYYRYFLVLKTNITASIRKISVNVGIWSKCFNKHCSIQQDSWVTITFKTTTLEFFSWSSIDSSWNRLGLGKARHISCLRILQQIEQKYKNRWRCHFFSSHLCQNAVMNKGKTFWRELSGVQSQSVPLESFTS